MIRPLFFDPSHSATNWTRLTSVPGNGHRLEPVVDFQHLGRIAVGRVLSFHQGMIDRAGAPVERGLGSGLTNRLSAGICPVVKPDRTQ